jgi:6-phosphogluconate dehydrogenase
MAFESGGQNDNELDCFNIWNSNSINFFCIKISENVLDDDNRSERYNFIDVLYSSETYVGTLGI